MLRLPADLDLEPDEADEAGLRFLLVGGSAIVMWMLPVGVSLYLLLGSLLPDSLKELAQGAVLRLFR